MYYSALAHPLTWLSIGWGWIWWTKQCWCLSEFIKLSCSANHHLSWWYDVECYTIQGHIDNSKSCEGQRDLQNPIACMKSNHSTVTSSTGETTGNNLPLRPLRKTPWSCNQPCFLLTSPPPLSLANYNKGTGQPEGHERVDHRKKRWLLPGIEAGNKDRSILRAIQIVRRAIHWVPAILEV